MEPTLEQDLRFGDPDAPATPWGDAELALEQAELYWISTVRADGRPHVTPLVGVWHDGGLWFCTGPDEQKARNLAAEPRVAATTGANTWKEGLDVVVEGTAAVVTDEDRLRAVADRYRGKYGGDWDFAVDGPRFRHPDGGIADVYAIEPTKVLAFAKGPYAQTRYRFGGAVPS